MALRADTIREFGELFERDEPPRAQTHRAVVTAVDDGTVYVDVSGNGDATPIETASAGYAIGDEVQVEQRGGRLHVSGNVTQPSVGARHVEQAVAPVAKTAAQGVKDSAAAQKIADEAQAVANATAQHFFDDSDGIHVTEADRDTWTAQHSGKNILINSLGILLRNALNNLVSITASAIAFFDGNGNNAANVVAQFGASGATIGKESSVHTVITSDGMSIEDSTGSYGTLRRADFDVDYMYAAAPTQAGGNVYIWGLDDDQDYRGDRWIYDEDEHGNFLYIVDTYGVGTAWEFKTGVRIGVLCGDTLVTFTTPPLSSGGVERVYPNGHLWTHEVNQWTGSVGQSIYMRWDANVPNEVKYGTDYTSLSTMEVVTSSASLYKHMVIDAALSVDGYIYPMDEKMADWVVEQGTSGIWTYRKWHSGIAECWGTYSASIAITSSSASYGGYRSAQITATAFPTGTFTAAPTVTATSMSSGGNWVTNTNGSTSTNAKFYMSCGTSSAASTRDIAIHAIGKWK